MTGSIAFRLRISRLIVGDLMPRVLAMMTSNPSRSTLWPRYRILNGRVSVHIPTQVPLIAALLISTMIVVLSLSVTLGSFALELHATVEVLHTPCIQNSAHKVIWQLRLPRFITACFMRIILAISGALLQRTTRNPLADPSLVGVSQGASFAVVFLTVIWPEIPI